MVAIQSIESPQPLVASHVVTDYFERFAGDMNCWGSSQMIMSFLSDMDILVSTKDHKAIAVAEAMDYHGVNRRLARLGIGHIDEPNEDIRTNTLIRGKARLSVDKFKDDYPTVISALRYFKGVELPLVIQDVRPGVGPAESMVLQPMTNPPPDVTANGLERYIKKSFHSHSGQTSVRIQNALDRVILSCDRETGQVRDDYVYSPVIAAMYVNYLHNPLNTVDQRTDYLAMCRRLKGNSKLEKNLKAAGGVLNEVLLLHAILRGNQIEASLVKGVSVEGGIRDRIANIPVRNILDSVYTSALLYELEQKIPLREDWGVHEEWLRNFASVALAIKDFATGGSYDAVGALYGQVKTGRSSSRDIWSAINLKPTEEITLST